MTKRETVALNIYVYQSCNALLLFIKPRQKYAFFQISHEL
jgi:hypothetical protein